jgi:hypothetical protein
MEVFNSIEIYIQRCKDMMKTDKKMDRLWARRMHTALKCYKENLITLFALEKKLSEEVKKNSASERARLNNIDTNIDSNDHERLVELAEQTLMNVESSLPPIVTQQESEGRKPLLDDKMTDLVERLKSIFLAFLFSCSSLIKAIRFREEEFVYLVR